ncbi:MAG: DUF1542 domain-containing protein [Gordonia sp. (in: high G+C Gram-positive bacteria)]|uniref:DUF1542 domain-containing protein n=1 Tax=Gordonia sp. (in: high G+C Gram-positive bacteria) TaxID=84139 RepID=UPI003C70EBAC
MPDFFIIVLIALIAVGIYFMVRGRSNGAQAAQARLDDAKADARQAIERLGGQVYSLNPGDDASARQSLADAGERFTAAGSQIEQAATPGQALLAKQTAIEGLYYIRAARTALNLDPGPPIPELEGQRAAGSVTEARAVEFEGREVQASPKPSDATPNYYPGGRVAGRPVPAGWYSEPWWKPALIGGAWGIGSALLFSSLFSGMAGIPAGVSDGNFAGGDMSDGGGDYGDGGAYGDFGDFGGGDFGGGDFGDFGGGDFGGFDF